MGRASKILQYAIEGLWNGYGEMKTSTAHARLESLQLAAEGCLSRKEAVKILEKAEKAHQKLESSAAPLHRRKAPLLKN